MKYSEAMLKGFEIVGGRQCREVYVQTNDAGKPVAYCVNGAAMAVGYSGSTYLFYETWGCLPHVLNDQGMPWEHLYGMAVAAGL